MEHNFAGIVICSSHYVNEKPSQASTKNCSFWVSEIIALFRNRFQIRVKGEEGSVN